MKNLIALLLLSQITIDQVRSISLEQMHKNAPTNNQTANAFAEPAKNTTALASPATNATMAAHPFFAQAEPAKNATASLG